jgi:hypothetical protein
MTERTGPEVLCDLLSVVMGRWPIPVDENGSAAR